MHIIELGHPGGTTTVYGRYPTRAAALRAAAQHLVETLDEEYDVPNAPEPENLEEDLALWCLDLDSGEARAIDPAHLPTLAIVDPTIVKALPQIGLRRDDAEKTLEQSGTSTAARPGESGQGEG